MADTVKLRHPTSPDTVVEVPAARAEILRRRGYVGEGDTSSAPAQSARKADWVDHAVAQGMSREDAEASTKDELVERFG